MCGVNEWLISLSEYIGGMSDELDNLKAENTKLRKLVTEIYPYAKACLQEWRIVGCIDSKSYDWYLQLRELGIEVDQ